jgi:NADH:ubiquinone oxidoreductase subunit K
MTPRHIQWLIAAVFFILGGWALLAPRSVIDLTLLPEYRLDARILPFTVACFGAQAMIAGLFAAFSRFTRATFLAYGLALLPFFAFNWWFTFVDPVFTYLGLLDAVGNIIMLALCVVGWRKSEA